MENEAFILLVAIVLPWALISIAVLLLQHTVNKISEIKTRKALEELVKESQEMGFYDD